jgi:hypothetical protein
MLDHVSGCLLFQVKKNFLHAQKQHSDQNLNLCRITENPPIVESPTMSVYVIVQ